MWSHGRGLGLVTQTFSVTMCYIFTVIYTELSCKNKCTVYQTSVGWCGSFKPAVGMETSGWHGNQWLSWKPVVIMETSGWYGNQTSGGSALTRCFDKLLGTSGVCFSCDGTLPYDGTYVCS